jgi:uncharacterized protein (DUF952 family)
MIPELIYHIADASAWAQSEANTTYAPPTYSAEGFIHCSTWAQLPGVANRYYANRVDLIVLEVETARLDSSMVFEDTTGRGEEYPHIYGQIAKEAIKNVLGVRWSRSGEPEFVYR